MGGKEVDGTRLTNNPVQPKTGFQKWRKRAHETARKGSKRETSRSDQNARRNNTTHESACSATQTNG